MIDGVDFMETWALRWLMMLVLVLRIKIVGFEFHRLRAGIMMMMIWWD